jgi:hypothetical protein
MLGLLLVMLATSKERFLLGEAMVLVVFKKGWRLVLVVIC